MQGKPKFAVKHNRRKENLSLYLIEKPRTPAERQQNKETLEQFVAYLQSRSVCEGAKSIYQRFKKVIRYAIDHDVMLRMSDGLLSSAYTAVYASVM